MQVKSWTCAAIFSFGILTCVCTNAYSAPLKLVFHDFAPFSFQDEEGHNQGILIDIANRICTSWDGSCDIKLKPNRRAKQMFASGEADGIFLGWNPERAKTMWFSIPMLETGYGFYSLSQNPFHSLEQISSSPVGVYGPSNTYTSLMKQQDKLNKKGIAEFEIEISPQGNELPLRMLEKQRFIAYYVNKDVGAYYAKKADLSGLNYLSAEQHVYYCIAFNMSSTKLESVLKFNRLLQKLLEQGQLDDIYKKWQMTPAYLDPVMYPEMNMPL